MSVESGLLIIEMNSESKIEATKNYTSQHIATFSIKDKGVYTVFRTEMRTIEDDGEVIVGYTVLESDTSNGSSLAQDSKRMMFKVEVNGEGDCVVRRLLLRDSISSDPDLESLGNMLSTDDDFCDLLVRNYENPGAYLLDRYAS